MLLDFEYVIAVLLDFESLKFKLCFLKKREGRPRASEREAERSGERTKKKKKRERERENERERKRRKGSGEWRKREGRNQRWK